MQNDLANLFGVPGGVDAASIPPAQVFDVLPPGKYPVKIEGAEAKRNSKDTGCLLKVTMKVLAQPVGITGMEAVVGRKLWSSINMTNPEPTCVDIGMRELAAIWQALGIPKISTTEEIIGGILIACVTVKGDRNEVRAYEPLPQANVAPPVASQAPAPPQAAPLPVAPLAAPQPLAPVTPQPPAQELAEPWKQPPA